MPAAGGSIGEVGPTRAQRGKGALEQMVVKSPKPIFAVVLVYDMRYAGLCVDMGFGLEMMLVQALLRRRENVRGLVNGRRSVALTRESKSRQGSRQERADIDIESILRKE